MYMSDAEIRDSWRNAIPGKNHAQVLADLNACSMKEMKEKLAVLGLVDRPPQKAAKKKKVVEKSHKPVKQERRNTWSLPPAHQSTYKKRSTWLHRQARELYEKGLTDGQIADAIGVCTTTVRRWRNRACLEPNKKKGVEK